MTIEAAAAALADERLDPALLQLQIWWEPLCDLEDALSTCCASGKDIPV